MDGAVMFIFFLVVVVVIVAAVAYQSHKKNELQQTYRRVAVQLGGVVRDGGMFSRPSIHFNYRGARAMIDVYSTGGKNRRYYTQIHIDWTDPRLRCEIYPEGFFNRLGMMLGFEDIQVGNRAFDDTYHISGNSPNDIRRLLTLQVQQAIHSLKQLTFHDDIYIAVAGGRLLIKKYGYLRDYNTLLQFTRLSLHLYDEALGTNTEGIEFVETTTEFNPTATFSVEEAICQICGDEIKQEIVFCRSCKTPHHEDCWTYYGACSTYGCGQTKFRRANERSGRRTRKKSR